MFKEGSNKVFESEEGNDEAFSYVVEYIYTKNIKITGDIKTVDGPNAATPNIFMLIKIWKEVDYLGMLPLVDFTMEKLYNAYPQDGVKEVNDMLHLVLPCYNTHEHSTLRK